MPVLQDVEDSHRMNVNEKLIIDTAWPEIIMGINFDPPDCM